MRSWKYRKVNKKKVEPTEEVHDIYSEAVG